MLTLTLLRHAKSSWDNPVQLDFDRVLNKRGKQNAEEVGQFLKSSSFAVDLTLCSTAQRTRETLELVRLNFNPGKVVYEEKIYAASLNALLVLVMEVQNAKSVLLIGHNPAITALAEFLSDEKIENIPTSGLVKMEFHAENWMDILSAKRKLTLKRFVERD